MKTNTHDLQRLIEVRSLYASGVARQLRQTAKVSQAEFARGIGVSRAAVCLWESGDRQPSTQLALRAWSLLDLMKKEGRNADPGHQHR